MDETETENGPGLIPNDTGNEDMNNITLGLLLAIGTVAVATTDVSEQMKQIFDQSLTVAQQVSTAGDLHSMSVMLDAGYVMDRRLPSKDRFSQWLERTFKENNVKSLVDDHWGNPYIYTLSKNGKNYELRSIGPDGLAGTDDDMVKRGP